MCGTRTICPRTSPDRYSASERLQNTSGPWGNLDIWTDGAGNRTSQELDNGSTTTDVYGFVSGTDQVEDVTTNSTLSRSFTYDDAGDVLTDAKGGVTTTYTYNDAGRMASLTVGSAGHGPYLYDGFGLLASRQETAGVSSSTVHLIYDQAGELIAEANAATGVTVPRTSRLTAGRWRWWTTSIRAARFSTRCMSTISTGRRR